MRHDTASLIVGFILLLSITAGALVTVSIIAYDFGLDTGSGEQIGYISEVENNGWIWKPTEIRLISINPVYTTGDTSWYYATSSKEITSRARGFMKNHTPVVVSYEVVMFTSRWDYSSRVIITDIAEVSD
jgi:hypothetical protein